MDDIATQRRSENMRRIRSIDTRPELLVRSLVHRLGYRFRLHGNDLPGKPDLVFASTRKVIFVHGCFWHQHRRCVDGRIPKSRLSYCVPKLEWNQRRDAANRAKLARLEWRSLTLWDCETKDVASLKKKIQNFLGHRVRRISTASTNGKKR